MSHYLTEREEESIRTGAGVSPDEAARNLAHQKQQCSGTPYGTPQMNGAWDD